MKKLNNTELLAIIGGASITGTLINAATSAAKFIYSMGQALGSSLRRISGRTLCPLR